MQSGRLDLKILWASPSTSQLLVQICLSPLLQESGCVHNPLTTATSKDADIVLPDSPLRRPFASRGNGRSSCTPIFLCHNVRSAHAQSTSAPSGQTKWETFQINTQSCSKKSCCCFFISLSHCNRHLGMPAQTIPSFLGTIAHLRFCRMG